MLPPPIPEEVQRKIDELRETGPPNPKSTKALC
jgi:hypothetical protein